ncbi:MAG: hypothetical protein Ct9H90mP16_17720 [Candidatus Poseidoniales archaeon]|nr:MAG: hypothetical protein Ct9H90mP16_17720 [Candidatus Poseidoniales archaeon]
MGLELIVQGPPTGKGFGMRGAFARFLTHDDEVLVMLDADGKPMHPRNASIDSAP